MSINIHSMDMALRQKREEENEEEDNRKIILDKCQKLYRNELIHESLSANYLEEQTESLKSLVNENIEANKEFRSIMNALESMREEIVQDSNEWNSYESNIKNERRLRDENMRRQHMRELNEEDNNNNNNNEMNYEVDIEKDIDEEFGDKFEKYYFGDYEEKFELKIKEFNENLEESKEDKRFVSEFNHYIGDNDDEEDDEIMMLDTGTHESTLKCPIMGTLMVHPVKSSLCGHSFEKDAIENHIKYEKKKTKGRGDMYCPYQGCKKVIKKEFLERDLELERQIERYKRSNNL